MGMPKSYEWHDDSAKHGRKTIRVKVYMIAGYPSRFIVTRTPNVALKLWTLFDLWRNVQYFFRGDTFEDVRVDAQSRIKRIIDKEPASTKVTAYPGISSKVT